MASYHEARRTGKFMGAYVCSNCKSVIMRDFEFYAAGYSRWTQKKAEEAAEAASEQGLAALNAFGDKPFLVTSPVEDRSYSLVSGFGTNGLERGCPYCGHRELWQGDPSVADTLPRDSETGAALVTAVPLMSRLKVTTAEDIQKLHSTMVALITDQRQRYWEEHTEEAAAVREQLQSIKEQIEVLTAQKESARDSSKELFAQMKQKEERLKGLSMFSSERKTCKAELKELEKQYNAQRTADIDQETHLGRSIQEQRKQLKEVLIKNPGVLGEYEQASPKDDPSIAAIRYN